jgi:hypothetical protein
VWEGRGGDAIDSRGRFVLGEASVTPAPDRAVVLALENGPDAVRLLAPDGGASLVGYGVHAHAEYYSGAPAADAPAGQSLGRAPDGEESGDNAADFAAAAPTPAAPNRTLPRWSISFVAPLARPELVEPGDTVRIAATARLLAGAAEPRRARLTLWASPEPTLPPPGGAEREPAETGTLVAASEAILGGAAGDSLPFSGAWAVPSAGAWRLALVATEDGEGAGEGAAGFVRAGPGPLLVQEIFYAPEPGQPEWIEVRARGLEIVDLSRFAVEDAAGRRGRLDVGAPVFLEPDSLAILVEDAAAFRAAHQDLDAARVHPVRPWPALNNTGAGGEPAERVRLRDERGVLADEVAYAGGDPTGYSLERRSAEAPSARASSWGVSAARGGTPLAANSLLQPPGEVALAISPAWWRRTGDPPRLRAAYRLAWPRAHVRVSVVDARGRERARLFDGPSSAVGGVEWDGRAGGDPLAPGAYALLLEARPMEGAGRLRLLRPLVLAP